MVCEEADTFRDDLYACSGYRLPTEAEWEYAARADETAAFQNGGDIADEEDLAQCTTDNMVPIVLDNGQPLSMFSWYCVTSYPLWSHSPVASLIPNDWGLYDVSGNVYEWCNDWKGDYGGDVTDPVGAASGESRARRGGSWGGEGEAGRLGNRGSLSPETFNTNQGLRLARTR